MKKEHKCSTCLYEYRCDWSENKDGACKHYIADADNKEEQREENHLRQVRG